MTKESGEGVGGTVLNVLKHPITIGTLGGAAIGGGLGYLTPKEKELRARSALAGAGTGALLGGLGGAIASSGASPGEMDTAASKAQNVGIEQGYRLGRREGFSKGYHKGQKDLIVGMPSGHEFTEEARAGMLRALMEKMEKR